MTPYVWHVQIQVCEAECGINKILLYALDPTHLFPIWCWCMGARQQALSFSALGRSLKRICAGWCQSPPAPPPLPVALQMMPITSSSTSAAGGSWSPAPSLTFFLRTSRGFLSFTFIPATSWYPQQHPVPPASCVLLWHALSQSVSLLLACTSEAYCWLVELLCLLHACTIPSLLYVFDASSIVWSLDIPIYMRFNCSTPGAVEMADWWFKDGWRQWLKEGYSLQHSNGVLLFYTSVTSPPKFVVLLVLDKFVIRTIKPSIGLFDCQYLNRSKISLEISMLEPDLVHASLKNQRDARKHVQHQFRWAQVISCDDDCDLREKHRHKFLIARLPTELISMSWVSKSVTISRCMCAHSDELEEGTLKEHSVQSCLGWRLVQMDNILCSAGRS